MVRPQARPLIVPTTTTVANASAQKSTAMGNSVDARRCATICARYRFPIARFTRRSTVSSRP